MTRDYSQFLPLGDSGSSTPRLLSPLETLGWQPYFAQQIDADELSQTPPVRVVSVHRNALQIAGDNIDELILPIQDVTVGDWLMLDRRRPQNSRVLKRTSLIKRRAPGTDRQEQLIAANIDIAFIVTSCNEDFNIARLERYTAVILDARITPVIVVTKTDITSNPTEYIDKARTISDLIEVVGINALGKETKVKLAQWCKPGKTVAFLGSSGVGKSTLANTLMEVSSIETQSIREDDAKGRHTTTRRQLHPMSNGCIILDSPGMRELQLTDASSGINDLFSDIHELSDRCRFNDCQHETEPGCAILQAIELGEIDAARLTRWRKLIAEDAFNSASIAERRSKDRAFGKMVRNVIKHKNMRR